LLCCEGHRDVDLTIWQDSAYGSRREEEFTGAATKVHAFVSKHVFAILIEDDILLSSDALLWFDKVYRLGLLQDGRNWVIPGQSIFFDSRGRDVDQDFVAGRAQISIWQSARE